MQFRAWNDIPEFMQNKKVKKYYDILAKRRFSLQIKRVFDIVVSLILIIVLSPVFLWISIWIKLDSKGSVFYCQERVTQYGKKFYIIKFRTMIENADQVGSLVTMENDSRITRVGKKIRKYRVDEIPQLFNILSGDMSFVGTRPEVQKYVDAYTEEMKATLLLPAGVTSEASIGYKDESEFLKDAGDVDEVYIEKILPEKMKWNLRSLRKFSLLQDLKTMIRTIKAIAS